MAVAVQAEKNKNKMKEEMEMEALIPGLPNEIAELCLLHLPSIYHSLVRSVSWSWNIALTNPSFLQSNKPLSPSLSRPFLSLLAFHRHTRALQWQALDLSSARWFLLPQMPLPPGLTLRASAIYCTVWPSTPQKGMLRVSVSDIRDNSATFSYSTLTNKWSPPVSQDGRPRAENSWMLRRKPCRPRLSSSCVKVEAAGVRAEAAGRQFWIGVNGDCAVKVYDTRRRAWQRVGGDAFPGVKLRRPFEARGIEGRIYVASSGLNVAVGSVVFEKDEEGKESVMMKWDLMKAPKAFHELIPYGCYVLHA